MARAKRQAKPTRRRNSNGTEAAQHLYEEFHQTPSTRTDEYIEFQRIRSDYAALGKLIEMEVWIDEDTPALLKPQGVTVAASPDGGSIYFVGGDQRLDLAALRLNKYLPKDHIDIGPVSRIVYKTQKGFHNFEPAEYEHEFADEGGEEPTLHYDALNQRLYLTGGSYTVAPEGIRD